jgi:hypothetical protein
MRASTNFEIEIETKNRPTVTIEEKTYLQCSAMQRRIAMSPSARTQESDTCAIGEWRV